MHKSLQNPEIIFSNDEFMVLNKPAGWLSIPAREPQTNDAVLTEWLKAQNGQAPLVVHRLDRFTSGIMLFAKTKEAHQKANGWFQNREVKKTYRFFASPCPFRPAIQIKTPVEGKPAQTLFEVIEKFENYFYGNATPLTGRFHQIREHAQTAGFPILGDTAYGGSKAILIQETSVKVPRVALHAYELKLPFGTFRADLPDDLATFLNQKNKSGAHP